MKKIYLVALSIIGIQGFCSAQTPCDAGRYSTELFPTVTMTNNVTFGSNTTFTGSNMTLNMNIFEPTGDVETARPLIIWAHGGSFIGGNKTDSDVVTLSNEFAKRGYVCASIDYRTGMWPIDSVNAIKAVIRAVQDMKAAVRFFYKDRATTNTFKIDTTKIFIGGSSAGAITALHMAYFDKECEIEPFISVATLNSLGGIEGTSGNPGYSSDVQGVINLCGALASYAYMEAGDVPVCSLHGNIDGTVPYNRGVASVSGFAIMNLDGSRVIHEQAVDMGVQSNFYTYYNQDHVPYFGSTPYMDTTVNFIRDFLIDQLACTDPALIPANVPVGSVTLYPPPFCGLATNDLAPELSQEPYPNPSDDQITLVLNDNSSINRVEVLDLFGRVISVVDQINSEVVISKVDIGAGTYIVRITANNGAFTTKKVVFQ